MIGKDAWVQTTKASGKDNGFVPAGLTGQVFWSGFAKGQPRLGIDLNGNGARIFVDASACESFDPHQETSGVQRNLFAKHRTEPRDPVEEPGCGSCGDPEFHDGEECPRMQRSSCQRCQQMRCPDGCCGCICGNPIFEKELASRIAPPKAARKLAPSQWDEIVPF